MLTHVVALKERNNMRRKNSFKIERMARVTDNGISGTVGNLVYYTMNGKRYVRTKPGPRKKRKGQPANPLNTVFGTVSKYGSRMIKQISTAFLFRFDRETYNRLRGWMRNQYAEHKDDVSWELSVKNSGMCRVNAENDLRDFFREEVLVNDAGNGKINVLIPELNPKRDIRIPLRTMKVNIKLIGVTSPFRNELLTCNFCTEQYSFIYNNETLPAKTIELQTQAGKDDIALVAMALEYEISDSTGNNYNKDQRWLPAAIIAMGKMK